MPGADFQEFGEGVGRRRGSQSRVFATGNEGAHRVHSGIFATTQHRDRDGKGIIGLPAGPRGLYFRE
jgi:hypothetical protein